jgi:uncharacterized protein (TIGR03437 family)
MRFLPFCLALCATVYSQEFVNGQAARLVIGQSTFTAQNPGRPASEFVVGGASGIAIAGDRLFVADASRLGAGPDNHRVLIYNNLSSLIPALDAELPQGSRCPACLGPASLVIGQPDFETSTLAITQDGMRLPTAVASDGNVLAVADTNNNRVLIWRSMPTRNGQPADVVIGQENFTTVRPPTTDPLSLRGPQGVWIHDGKLFIADTQNHRVLIYNRIPTSNGAAADVVLGQPDFFTTIDPFLANQTLTASREGLRNPVSVMTDGVRLLVADLGHNRVAVWNSIPTSNFQPIDFVLGQSNFTNLFANASREVCDPTGNDEETNEPIYPQRCAATLSFPRFALSDGEKLYVADGGNDRILVWNQMPSQNGAKADVVLGQLSEFLNNTSDSAFPDDVSATDVLRTPMALAKQGPDLYVSDTFNRRILIFTPANPKVPRTGVRNSASFETYAVGTVTFGGNLKTDDEVTVKIEELEYKYKIVENETFDSLINSLVDLINADAGDPNVVAAANPSLQQLRLTARVGGEPGNDVSFSTSLSEGAELIAQTSGANLSGGQDATRLAGGTIVSIVGERLSDVTEVAPEDADPLPERLGGVEVYFDGIKAPLFFVSPTQINAQLPWEVGDGNSSNAVVRTIRSDGTIDVSSAVGVPVIPQNPGIYALSGVDPRPGIVLHGSSYATATVSVDGSATAGDKATIIIGGDREYTYDVKEGDNLISIRFGLIDLINGAEDPQVVASSAGVFDRIRLQGRIPGPVLNGVSVATRVSNSDGGEGGSVILTALNNQLCCANVEDSPVTPLNPAVPGETIKILATGLGRILPEEAQEQVKTGQRYAGPADNQPQQFVNSLAGGKTANVLFARLLPGRVGLYEVVLELNSDLPTNDDTQLWIAQSFQISNIVRFALRNPRDGIAPPDPLAP